MTAGGKHMQGKHGGITWSSVLEGERESYVKRLCVDVEPEVD